VDDPALEAICLKAMKTHTAQRYATPRALADDVEHWLADEPVGAYTEPVTVQAKRWMRKHPSRVTAAAVLMLATVTGLAAGTVLLSQMNRLIKAEKAVAEKNFQMARNAVDTYFTNVSEEDLLKEDRLQRLRKKLLTSALPYYEDFIKQRVDDPNVRKELADAYTRAGNIYQATYTGSDENVGSKRGTELLIRGVALYEELVREKPEDQELRVALAGGLRGLMLIYWVDGEYEAGVNSGNRAIQLWEQLRAEDPSNVNFGRMLGDSYSYRAIMKRDSGDREGQATDILRAVEIFQEIVRSAPDDEETLSELAAAYRRSDRLEDLLEAVRITRQLAKSGNLIKPGIAAPLLQKSAVMGRESILLTNALGNAAGKYAFGLGQPGKAAPLYQESVELGRERMRQSPESNTTIHEFVTSAGNLGETRFLQGKTQPASKVLKETVSGTEELKRRNFSQGAGDNPTWFRYILGCLEFEKGDIKGGLDRCESVMRGEEELLAQSEAPGKGNPRFVANSLTMRETIARFRALAKRSSREEWLAQERQILTERKALHEREPKVRQYEWEVSGSAAVLAGLLLETGRGDETLAVAEDVLPTLEKLVHDDKPDSSQPSEVDSRNYFIRRVRAELLARKGEALARTGKGADASKAIRQATEITEDLCKQEPCYLYDLAHHLTLASTLPGSASVSDAADRAVKALREYIASGFDNPYKLRHDPRLEPLRKRDDFQKLVKELEAKVAKEAEK